MMGNGSKTVLVAINYVITFIYTIWIWTMVFVVFICHIPSASLIMLFFKDRLNYRIKSSRFWLKVLFVTTGIRINVTGLKNLDQNIPIVIMSNHMSHLDIPVLISALPYNLAFIAKKSLIKVPLLGLEMFLQKHLFINRKNPRQSLKILKKIPLYLHNHRSVIIFPEGTRSPTGELRPFHRIVFSILIKNNLPVLPICIIGSNKVLAKNKFYISHGNILIKIGKPITSNGLTDRELMEKTRQQILLMQDH